MSLISNLTQVEARLSDLRDRFGDPRLVNVVIEYQGVQTLIRPKPQVQPVNPERIGKYLDSNVEILGNEEVIAPLYRTLPEDYYTEGRYILDAVWDGTQWVGSWADVLHVDRSKPRQYTVYVARERKR